ncbi:hypothetical protein ZIOFF_042146 [Zingiber officinale]|uniref:Uncharacterized protein n=1 Tax=Zingiber officinale TaxID=94328 RepID=A0A8J5L213_ZINOF|nr:hypothetical protein ZIOFF_042146 [Zingiber officinale]
MATTRTEQQQVTTIPLFEDQIRGYRRNQRRLYNAQQAARRVGQALTGGTSTRHTLEQQIEPEAQLQLSMQERASIVPAEVLYHSRRDDAHHRAYVHRSKEVMLVTDNHQADRSFIQEESFHQLRRSGMQYIHLGVLQVRIQILHRQREGTMAFIVFRDNRWQGDQAILATMEVDLTHGSHMNYVIPEIMMTIGRLSNTPNVGFAYEIQGVVDYLTSHGVKALPGRSFSTSRLQGLNWTINPTQIAIPMQPAEAVLPKRQTEGSAGLDIAASHASIIEPYGRHLIHTGLWIEIPYGYYGRIASRSGLAWKSGIEVGAGVIDSNFRGEVQVLLFNRTNLPIMISSQQIIAQLILEKIAMPEVYEVPHLSYTDRGDKGFGSTDHHVFLPVDEASSSHEPQKLTTQDIFSLLLPQEKIAFLIEGDHFQNSFEQNHAATTSPGASVPHSMQTTLSYEEKTDSYLDYIQYLASLSNTEPLWDTYPASDTEWTNPFASEGGGRQENFIEIIPAHCEEFVAMHPDSIEWTAFWVPDGLYEWLVMSFGLKNAPAIFQRKIDLCFKETEDFIAVYIDDILVFSPDERSHEQHLQRMLNICQLNWLVLSSTKMKIAVSEIEFLGAIIGNCGIKLQPHVISKIANFKDNELKTTKGMRSWLGLLNYARKYIPNLGKLLGPLYAKTSPNGEKKLNQQYWDLIKQIKEKVKQLPDLEIPPLECYIILEVDGCMDGWGGICKWKKNKFDPISSEKICTYASGKFNPPKSTIDVEIHAVQNTMEALKIYFLDKTELW